MRMRNKSVGPQAHPEGFRREARRITAAFGLCYGRKASPRELARGGPEGSARSSGECTPSTKPGAVIALSARANPGAKGREGSGDTKN